MNKEEFIKQRCEIDKITEEEFKKKYRVVKCYCGQPYCKGYRCLDLDDLLRENKQLEEVIDKITTIIKGTVYGENKDYYIERMKKILQMLEDKEVSELLKKN